MKMNGNGRGRETRVVMAADNGYARALAVAGRSVIAHLGAARHLEFNVLDMGISAENRALIAQSFADPRVNVIFNSQAQERVKGLPTFGWFTTAAYARLMIPSLLPETARRALYLDCDLIANRCVGGLYDMDTKGFVSLAVPDQGAPFVACQWGLAHWFDAGRQPSDYNFNTGVMLMDLDVWRRERVSESALEYLRSDRYQQNVDQEALNAVAGNRFLAVDPRWNQQAELFQRSCELALPYSRDVVANLKKDPYLIHFSTGLKPWIHGCEHPWLGTWLEHLDHTAYAGWRPQGPKRSKVLLGRAKNVVGNFGRRFGVL